jgi:hypothetical protein
MRVLSSLLYPPPQMVARPPARTFHAFNVSLAKTGTRSIAGIFANYRSLHEYRLPDTLRAVADRESGVMSESRFREFIRGRDELTQLDMDSSSYNCYYVDVLAQEYPDAKFVFAIRDCYAWLDSFLNMVLFLGPVMADWFVVYIRRFLGPGYEYDLADRPDELLERLPDMVDAGFRYWSTMNRFVLDRLPGDRSLVLKTRDISHSLPRLASLVGVPPETLNSDLSRLNEAGAQFYLLHDVDREMLADRSAQHCADLMREFFPDVTVAGFLERNRPV